MPASSGPLFPRIILKWIRISMGSLREAWQFYRDLLQKSLYLYQLAVARLAEWEKAKTVAARLRESCKDPVVQVMLAWIFPEIPDWAESLVGQKSGLVQCLSACVRDSGKLPYVNNDYFWDFDDEARLAMLAASGPKAAKFLAERAAKTWQIAHSKHAASLLGCIGTSEAKQLLEGLRGQRHGAAAWGEWQERFGSLGL
jgi:hypothetical protein